MLLSALKKKIFRATVLLELQHQCTAADLPLKQESLALYSVRYLVKLLITFVTTFKDHRIQWHMLKVKLLLN